MSRFTYTAKRGLISGHVVDTVYSLDIQMKSYEAIELINGHQQVAGSKAETVLNNIISSHKFSTIALSAIERLKVREFLLSAVDGQLITFDGDGSVAVPVNPITGKLKLLKTLSPSKPDIDLYIYSFEVLEVS